MEELDYGQVRMAKANVVLVAEVDIVSHGDLIAFLLRELVFVGGVPERSQSVSTNVARVRGDEAERFENYGPLVADLSTKYLQWKSVDQLLNENRKRTDRSFRSRDRERSTRIRRDCSFEGNNRRCC